MIHEIVQIQDIDLLHIGPLVLDQLKFDVKKKKVLVLDIVIVVENSIVIELHHASDTLTLLTNEETLEIHMVLLSEKFATVFLQIHL